MTLSVLVLFNLTLRIQFFLDKMLLHSANSSHVSKKNVTFKFKGNEDISHLKMKAHTHTYRVQPYLSDPNRTEGQLYNRKHHTIWKNNEKDEGKYQFNV